jgi:hypothetical protein
LAPGWVVYQAGTPPPERKKLPFALQGHLRKDLTEHPTVRVRSSLGIVQDGNTVAIHLWYDQLPG